MSTDSTTSLEFERIITSLNEQFPCRDRQIRQLGNLLVKNNGNALPPLVICHGLEATGKTQILKTMLDIFEISSTWVSCSECVTFRHLLETIGHAFWKSAASLSRDSSYTVPKVGRIDNVNGLYVQLQNQPLKPSNHILVLDDFDRHREASQASFAAVSRLGDVIHNLSVILILRYPKTRHLSTGEPPCVQFSAYNKDESVKILSMQPSPTVRSLETMSEATALEVNWLWSQCCAALWETLGKSVARNLQLLRECAEETWSPLVQPIIDGEHVPSEFSKLFNRLKSEKLKGNEESFLNNTVRSEREDALLPKSVKQDLPYLSKFLLCAAYLASHIPASQDLRIFSKGPERTRRKHKGVSRAKKGVHKRQLNRRHLGPRVFSLERLLAIFHALVPADIFSSVDLDTQVSTLRALRLITKSSAAANMDGSTKWKVNVGYGYVHAIGRSLDIDLDMYLED